MARFRVLGSEHSAGVDEDKKVFKKGSVVVSDKPLDKMFANKFRRLDEPTKRPADRDDRMNRSGGKMGDRPEHETPSQDRKSRGMEVLEDEEEKEEEVDEDDVLLRRKTKKTAKKEGKDLDYPEEDEESAEEKLPGEAEEVEDQEEDEEPAEEDMEAEEEEEEKPRPKKAKTKKKKAKKKTRHEE